MGLCDPTEEHSHHTWGAEHHVRLLVRKRETSCIPGLRELNAVTPGPRIIKLLQAEGEPQVQSTLREAKLSGPIIPADLHPRGRAGLELACKATRLSQQERAPGHQEEQASLQQWELPKFGELGDVRDG